MSAKKKTKSKGTTVSLQEFNSRLESTPANGQNVIYAPKVAASSWAQEMEEEDTYTEKERIVLPSAPRASRLQQQVDSIPNTAPFTAHLGNISYDINEEDVTEFFLEQEIVDLRLPRDGSRLRGFGYVEFKTREELIEALELNGQVLKGRPLRISLGAPGANARGGQGNEERRGGGGGRYDTDDTPDDWRSGGGQVVDSLRPDSYANDDRRGGGFGRSNDFGGGFGGKSNESFGQPHEHANDERRGGGFGRSNDFGGGFGGGRSNESFSNDERDRKGFNVRSNEGFGNEDRRGGFGGRSNDSFGNEDRRGGGGYAGRSNESFGNEDRDRRGYGGRSGEAFSNDDRDRKGFGVRPDEAFSNDDRDRKGFGVRPDEAFSNDDRDRKGFNVRPKEAFSKDNRDRTGFGERSNDSLGNEDRRGSNEITPAPASQQQPHERKKLVLAPRSKPIVNEPAPESSTSIFGGAKPVDTAAKDREIEEKLKGMERVVIDTKGGDVRRSFDEDSNGRSGGIGLKGPIRILKRNEGASALNSNAMPPLITNNNNRRQQRGFSHGRERTSSESSQPSPHPQAGPEDYEKDTNSEPEDERDLRRQQAMHSNNESDDGFIEVQKRRSNHSKIAAHPTSK